MKKFVDEREEYLKLKIGNRCFKFLLFALAAIFLYKIAVLKQEPAQYRVEQMLMIISGAYYGISCTIMGLDAKTLEKNYKFKNWILTGFISLAVAFVCIYLIKDGEMNLSDSFSFAAVYIVVFLISQRLFLYIRKRRAESLSKKFDE